MVFLRSRAFVPLPLLTRGPTGCFTTRGITPLSPLPDSPLTRPSRNQFHNTIPWSMVLSFLPLFYIISKLFFVEKNVFDGKIYIWNIYYILQRCDKIVCSLCMLWRGSAPTSVWGGKLPDHDCSALIVMSLADDPVVSFLAPVHGMIRMFHFTAVVPRHWLRDKEIRKEEIRVGHQTMGTADDPNISSGLRWFIYSFSCIYFYLFYLIYLNVFIFFCADSCTRGFYLFLYTFSEDSLFFGFGGVVFDGWFVFPFRFRSGPTADESILWFSIHNGSVVFYLPHLQIFIVTKRTQSDYILSDCNSIWLISLVGFH